MTALSRRFAENRDISNAGRIALLGLQRESTDSGGERRTGGRARVGLSATLPQIRCHLKKKTIDSLSNQWQIIRKRKRFVRVKPQQYITQRTECVRLSGDFGANSVDSTQTTCAI